jgi:hypothetical protein
MAAVLLVPATFLVLALVLVVAEALERRASVFLVRSSLRSPVSYELTEAIVAADLAPHLEAAGLSRPWAEEQVDEEDGGHPQFEGDLVDDRVLDLGAFPGEEPAAVELGGALRTAGA